MSDNNDLPTDSPPVHVLMYAEYTSEAEMQKAVADLRNKKLRGIPQRHYFAREPSFKEMELLPVDTLPNHKVFYDGKNDQGRRIATVFQGPGSDKFVAWWVVEVDKGTHMW